MLGEARVREIRHLCAFGLIMACTPLALAAGPADAPRPFVAGLQPDRRPAGAPVLSEQVLDAATRERRLHGVAKPWPGNVGQIAETGNWFVPLRHAGMTGPYDIRGWHSRAPMNGPALNPPAVSKP